MAPKLHKGMNNPRLSLVHSTPRQLGWRPLSSSPWLAELALSLPRLNPPGLRKVRTFGGRVEAVSGYQASEVGLSLGVQTCHYPFGGTGLGAGALSVCLLSSQPKYRRLPLT